MKTIALLLFFVSSASFAAQKSSTGSGRGATLKLLAGVTALEPKQVNDSLKSQGLEEVSRSLLLGGELGYTFNRVGLGIRYLSNQASQGEKTDIPNVDYTASISQSMFLAMVRAPIYRSDFMQFDLFGGYGSAGTIYKVKSATQRGELKRNFGQSGLSTGGASLNLGYKNFFITFEGGYMNNKATNMSRSGTVSSDIQTVDLSGTYATVGLLFYGSGTGGIIDWIGKKSGMAK